MTRGGLGGRQARRDSIRYSNGRSPRAEIFFPANNDEEAGSICTAHHSVKLEVYAEPGPHGPMPWIRCIDTIEGTVFKRIPAWMVIINYAPRQHLFTPDSTGVCIHCDGYESSRDPDVCVDRPKKRKSRAVGKRISSRRIEVMGCRGASLNGWPGTQGTAVHPVATVEMPVEQLGLRAAIVNCCGARRKLVPPSGPRKGLHLQHNVQQSEK